VATRRSFWPGRTARGGSLAIGDVWRSSGRYGVEQRGAWLNRWRRKVKWAAASSVMSGALIRGAKPRGAATTDGYQCRAPFKR
jgi:hypothetical protein